MFKLIQKLISRKRIKKMYKHFAVAVTVASQAAFALSMTQPPADSKYDEF